MEDLNVELEEADMKSFCENYNLRSLIKQRICYKNPDKPIYNDLILTNVPCMIQSASVIEVGLFDLHLTTVKFMRKTFEKVCPRIINYSSFRDFSNKTFRASEMKNLCYEVFVNDDDGLEKFCKTAMNTLNNFAPMKKKYARGNQMPVIIK